MMQENMKKYTYHECDTDNTFHVYFASFYTKSYWNLLRLMSHM